jgi:alpha-tubulin suppressor-like RCC1 family protein
MRHIRLTGRFAPALATAFVVAVLGCREDAVSPTAPEPVPALKTTQSQALSFRQVSAGIVHTCGVTPDDRAYCWGANFQGQLGDGTTTDHLTPVPVPGGLRFRQVSAGSFRTCGVTVGHQAYCWGQNFFGQLGDGTRDNRPAPVAVAGGLRFRQVSAGGDHTCGVTLDDRVYCWGNNGTAQFGDSTRSFGSPTPVLAAGGLRFREVSAGGHHTCGVTPGNRAYCWGDNTSGQLGDGTFSDQLTPIEIAGGSLRFRQVSASIFHSCGVTPDNRAYCWGANFGRVGDGTGAPRPFPTPVAGGLRFRQVTAGGHSCGVTLDNRAYCWGPNNLGELGDGTTIQRLTPVAVAGGQRFREVSAGSYTCGVATGHRAYCWGDNRFGQLGDGTTINRLIPVPVVGSL